MSINKTASVVFFLLGSVVAMELQASLPVHARYFNDFESASSAVKSICKSPGQGRVVTALYVGGIVWFSLFDGSCRYGHQAPYRDHSVSNYTYKLARAGSQRGCNTIGLEAGEGGECFPPDPPLGQDNNNGDSCHNTSNPINIATGNKYFARNDFTGGGVSPLRLDFFYNSNTNTTTWTASYRQHLTINSQTIEARRANGRVIFFEINDGEINTQSQQRAQLTLNQSLYTLSLPNNTIETYNTNGQLLAIQYPNGIRHTLAYNDNTIEVTRLNQTLQLTYPKKPSPTPTIANAPICIPIRIFPITSRASLTKMATVLPQSVMTTKAELLAPR